MLQKYLGLALLLAIGLVLATVAVNARERTYVAPQRPRAVTVPLVLTGEIPPGHALRTFAVDGICCQGCGGKLHGALMALEGVREVAVDPLRGEVQALVRADVPEERLTAALTFGPYSVRAR